METQLKNIHQKLQQLLKNYQLLQKENAQLKKDLDGSKTKMENKSQQLQSLQQQLDMARLGKGGLTEEERVSLSKKIDQYLKEIDKCLLLLNGE